MHSIAEPGGTNLPSIDAGPKWSAEQVCSIRYWTPNLLSFRVTRPAGFRFTPGHYARLGLTAGDGTLVWRPYSMVSAADDEQLEFLAILIPQGAFSTLLKNLQVGDSIQVEKASFGFLTVDQLAAGHDLWLLASGTGLGPFVSILRDPAVWQTFERLIVVHSVRRSPELAYRDELGALQATTRFAGSPARLTYIPVVTREPGATPLKARIPQLFADGRLSEAAGQVLDVSTSRVMVCGNPEMALEMRQLLAARGFAPSRRGVPGQMAFEKYW